MASASTQLSDKFLVENEMHFDNFNKISTDKSVVYCIDSNNNSYTNGIVNIDTTNQLGGNNGMASISEGYLIVPYPVTMKNTGLTNATAAAANAFSLSLKANVANVIDRVDISLNGKPVVSGQSFSNMWNNIRAQYSYSASTIQKEAGTTLIYPDDTWSIGYSGAASTTGDGYSNGGSIASVANVTTATVAPYPYNSGHFKRMQESAAVGGASNCFGWKSQATNATQNHINNGESYFVAGAATANTVMGTWYFMLKIKLTDIHPIFETLDLLSNPQLRMTLYFQVGSASLTVAASSTHNLNGAPALLGGNTCPVLLSSAVSGQPNASVLSSASGTTVGVAWGVVNNLYTSAASSFAFNSTRLYLPFYRLVPEIERSLIERPVQKKIYNDCYIQPFVNAASSNGQSFTLTVQATLPNIQYIAVVPFANGTVSGNNFASTATGTNEFASPYDSAPWTTMPGCGIFNMQVQVGSQSIYKNLLSYDWQNFLDEVSNIFAINGGDSKDIGNGLIDQLKWQTAYKTWLFDVSRVSSDVRQNVNIQGTLQCDQGTDFYVIIVYRRSFDLNRITCEVTNQIN